MLRSWITDARYAARRLRARPGYTLLAVLTLALGIGGTAAVYGIARPLLFDPLPYANEREVGVFWMPFDWTEEEFLHLRGRFPGFRQVAAYRPGDVTLRDGEAPARLLPGIASSAELFDVLGARPVDRAAASSPATTRRAPSRWSVLSHGLWQELGGTPSVVGAASARRRAAHGGRRDAARLLVPGPRGARVARAAAQPAGAQRAATRSSGASRRGRTCAHGAAAQRLTAMIDERFDYPRVGQDEGAR
jgi:hypothetical protein